MNKKKKLNKNIVQPLTTEGKQTWEKRMITMMVTEDETIQSHHIVL